MVKHISGYKGGGYMSINPYNLIAPHFYTLFDDVLDNKHTHYWLKRWER